MGKALFEDKEYRMSLRPCDYGLTKRLKPTIWRSAMWLFYHIFFVSLRLV